MGDKMPTLAPVVTVTTVARSVTVRVTALVAGPVLVRAAVCGSEHGLEVLVRLPGPRAAHHTALLVELGQHAALAQHSLQLGSGALANTLTISVTGDTVGPLLLGELQPPVTSYFNVLPLKILGPSLLFMFTCNNCHAIAAELLRGGVPAVPAGEPPHAPQAPAAEDRAGAGGAAQLRPPADCGLSAARGRHSSPLQRTVRGRSY